MIENVLNKQCEADSSEASLFALIYGHFVIAINVESNDKFLRDFIVRNPG